MNFNGKKVEIILDDKIVSDRVLMERNDMTQTCVDFICLHLKKYKEIIVIKSCCFHFYTLIMIYG